MESLFLSLMAFVSTNIDDLFINMLFFAQQRSSADVRRIVVGKYLGMGVLTMISLLGAFGLQLFTFQHLSLLGFVPLALGIREIIRNLRGRKREGAPASTAKTPLLGIMLVTIANGADNIGVYLPLFSSFTIPQMGIAAAVFAFMTGLWCHFSMRLSGLPILQNALIRYQTILIPLVYILLGLFILL